MADGAIRVAEVVDPTPGPEELLVRVAGAGVNAADLLQRAGLYPAPPGAPTDIPGMEVAGVVDAVGVEVRAFRTGDRVMAIVGGGAQAERCVVHASHALSVPAGTALAHAGGFPEAFATAHDALVTQGGLCARDRVLVTGASGGVGTAAVQLAHALGATVVASVRDVGRHAAVRALGADDVVVPDEVGAAGPFDVVLELIGAASLTEVQRHLAPLARVIVIGVGGGSRVELDLLAVMARRATVRGSTLRSRSIEDKAAVIEGVRRDVADLFAHGEVHVPVHATFALDDVEAAYAAFGTSGKLGKVIITP